MKKSELYLADCGDKFYVVEQPWKTWISYREDGTELVTGLEMDIVLRSTNSYLTWLKNGSPTE